MSHSRKTFFTVRGGRSLAVGGLLLTLAGCSNVVSVIIDQHLQPTVVAASEEHCVASELILEEIGLASGNAIAPVFATSFNKLSQLASGDEDLAMYCKQNMVGAAAVTDKALRLMLEEITSGFEVTIKALGIKDKDIRETLLAVQQLQARGVSIYAGDQVDVTVERVNKISTELQAQIDARLATGGLSEESKRLLVKAVEHLRGASYYRGKALVGAKVIYLNLQREGVQNHIVRAVQSKGKGESFQALKQIATGGLNLARGTGDSLELTNKIHDLADQEGFKRALDDLENPNPEESDSLAKFAEAEAEENEDLGLPTFEEI